MSAHPFQQRRNVLRLDVLGRLLDPERGVERLLEARVAPRGEHVQRALQAGGGAGALPGEKQRSKDRLGRGVEEKLFNYHQTKRQRKTTERRGTAPNDAT